MSEIKLTIDEVIEHCERTSTVWERRFTRDKLNEEPLNNNFIKQYWEHKQVAEWLKELKHLRGAMERIEERLEEDAFEVHTKEYGIIAVVGLDNAIEICKEEGGIE